MSEKRFKLDIGDDYSFIDDIIQDETYTIYNDRFKEVWGQKIVDLLNSLSDENEQLRKQCFELEKDYLIETSDISDKIYLDDEIKELKQKYGVKDE